MVGNFLRDGSSNYLEGGLLVVCAYVELKEVLLLTRIMQMVYIIVALTAWYYPNAELTTSNQRSSEGGGEGTEALVHVAKMLMKT